MEQRLIPNSPKKRTKKVQEPRPLKTYDIMCINFSPYYTMEYLGEIQASSTASALAQFITNLDNFQPQQVFHTQTNYCGKIDSATYFHNRDGQIILYIAKRLVP